MNNSSEFERGIRYLIENLDFDVDSTVSLFETNIRALGGLLSAHVLAADRSLGLMSEPYPESESYGGGLLPLALDLGNRLLPALDTLSGIPFGSINLRKGVAATESPITCTAAAGTLVLEFGALTRLTGDGRCAGGGTTTPRTRCGNAVQRVPSRVRTQPPVSRRARLLRLPAAPPFEAAARRAAVALWSRRSEIDLLGAHLSLRSGAWTQADAGVGRGIDSFYEYMLKGSMLFREPDYLAIFHDSYHAALRHCKHGHWYVDVHMSTAQVTWPLFNSLQGFWPGMQMLVGELDDAAQTLRAFHSLWVHIGFHPEGFNLATMQVQEGQRGYPLRPEHVESLFWAHRTTGGDEWLHAGRDVLQSLQKLRVPCGVAAVADV
eukprot:2220706-Prymnesium_polylepis.1